MPQGPRPFVQEVKVKGSEEAIRQLRDMGFEVEGLGDATQETGQTAGPAAGEFNRFGGVLDRGVGSVLSFAGGLLGAAGLRAAMQATREESELSRQALLDYVDAMAATIALTKDPKFLEIATNASVQSGRPIEEIGKSVFAITSSLGKDPKIAESIINEAIEISKTEPAVPLDQVIDLLVRLKKIGGPNFTAQQGQNFSIKTEEFSTANIGDLASNLPKLLGVGQPAGLGFPDIGALFAVATGQLSPDIAGTAVENVISGLANPKSKEAQELLKSLGVGQDASVPDKLKALAARNAQQPLSVAENQSLVGQGPGAAFLPTLLAQLEDFNHIRAEIDAAIQPGAPDLGAINLRALETTLPGFSEVDRTRQAEQRLEDARRTSGVALEEEQSQAIRTEMERRLIERDASPARRLAIRNIFDTTRGLGLDPIGSMMNALNVGVQLGDSRQDVAELGAHILRETVPEANISAEDIRTHSPPNFNLLRTFLDDMRTGADQFGEFFSRPGREFVDMANELQRRVFNDNSTNININTQYLDNDPLIDPPAVVDANQ